MEYKDFGVNSRFLMVKLLEFKNMKYLSLELLEFIKMEKLD
jgi:hypothetical protein